MDAVISLVEILALVMYSEAGILRDSNTAMAVGHVFMNRLDNGSFGATPEEVSKGFHAVNLVDPGHVPWSYSSLAKRVIEEDDNTRGSLYVISWTDAIKISKLAGYPGYSRFLRAAATWQSRWRIIDGDIYGLYAYKKYPVTVLQDMMKDISGGSSMVP